MWSENKVMNAKFETTLERPLRLRLNQELLEERREIPSTHYVEPPVPMSEATIREPAREVLPKAANWTRKGDFQRILVATDFSPSSSYAINRAQRLAEQVNGELLLLYVALPLASHGISVNAQEGRRRAKELRRHAEQMLAKQIEETLGPNLGGMAARTLIIEGYAHEDIVREAVANEVDMIVIARHGHSDSRSLPLGPTAEAVIRQAHCPVLLVGD
ncbi:hypothetical protein BH09VER1_BH09VER1_52220 [soil metagenome]